MYVKRALFLRKEENMRWIYRDLDIKTSTISQLSNKFFKIFIN